MHGSVELQSWGEDQRQDMELMETIDILDGTKHNRACKQVHKRFELDDVILFRRGEGGKRIVVPLPAVTVGSFGFFSEWDRFCGTPQK